jgi:flagellar hook-associated protein FlgK
MFTALKNSFIQDILTFYNQFKNSVIQLQQVESSITTKTEHCKTCVNATVEDLNYMYNKFEELTRDVIKKGFSILLGVEQVK